MFFVPVDSFTPPLQGRGRTSLFDFVTLLLFFIASKVVKSREKIRYFFGSPA